MLLFFFGYDSEQEPEESESEEEDSSESEEEDSDQHAMKIISSQNCFSFFFASFKICCCMQHLFLYKI